MKINIFCTMLKIKSVLYSPVICESWHFTRMRKTLA